MWKDHVCRYVAPRPRPQIPLLPSRRDPQEREQGRREEGNAEYTLGILHTWISTTSWEYPLFQPNWDEGGVQEWKKFTLRFKGQMGKLKQHKEKNDSQHLNIGQIIKVTRWNKAKYNECYQFRWRKWLNMIVRKIRIQISQNSDPIAVEDWITMPLPPLAIPQRKAEGRHRPVTTVCHSHHCSQTGHFDCRLASMAWLQQH